jgi:hypothetical protein
MLAEGPCRVAMIAASPYRFAIVEPHVMQAAILLEFRTASFARQHHSAHAEEWILDSQNQFSLAQSGETIWTICGPGFLNFLLTSESSRSRFNPGS